MSSNLISRSKWRLRLRLPLDPYIIEAVAQSYEFWFLPLKGSDDPIALARQTLP